MNILTQTFDFGWDLCKAALQNSGSFVAVHLTAKAHNIEPLIFNNQTRPYIDDLTKMMACGQIILGMGILLKNHLSCLSTKRPNWREIAQKLVQVSQGILLLFHLENPSVYTSTLLGGSLLATGIERMIDGGSQIHRLEDPTHNVAENPKTFPKSRRWGRLAQAIVLCGLGMWGVYSSIGPLSERLHHWQPLTNRMEFLRDYHSWDLFINCGQEFFGCRGVNDFIYDPFIQKEFTVYCTDSDVAADSCAKKIYEYLIDKRDEGHLDPHILSQLKFSSLTPLELLRVARKFCGMRVTKDPMCSNLWEGYMLKKISDVIDRTDDPDRTWRHRLKSLESVFQMAEIRTDPFSLVKPLKRFNVAVILNGGDSPDSLDSTDQSLLSLANVYVERISKEQGICDILKKALAWNGRSLDLVSIIGHGNEHGVTLSSTFRLNTTNVADVGHCFKEALAPGASIALSSCSTGRKRPLYLNFAERLAGETGYPVDAPTQDSREVECSFSLQKTEVNGMVANSTGGLLFQCEKTKKFEGETNDDDMEFGKYTKRFIRNLSERDEETVRFDMGFI